MIIFGHPWVDSPTFYKVDSIEEIKKTPPNSLVLLQPLSYSLDVAKYCQKNEILYCLEVDEVKDALFANILGAKYILTSRDLAKILVPIAQNYLFDSLILAKVDNDEHIEEMAKANVDGVKFGTF